METLIILIFLIAAGLAAYRFIHMFTSNMVTANDEYFKQAGVCVNFKEHTIDIKGKVYDVKKVTGLTTVTQSGGRGMGDALRSTVGMVEIKVDDFKKPIHRVTISGGQGKAGNFMQRLSTALRQAGGPSFY